MLWSNYNIIQPFLKNDVYLSNAITKLFPRLSREKSKVEKRVCDSVGNFFLNIENLQ